MFSSLAERMRNYEENHDYSLIRRLPVVIRADGIGFTRLTSKLPKPSDDFIHCMANSMLYTLRELGGAIFGYTQSDEITFVLRNDLHLDDEPWLGNRLQKIISRVASLTTIGFERSLATLENRPELVGEALFDVRVTVLPDLVETANNLIWRQQDGKRNALSMAILTHLSEKMTFEQAGKFILQKNSQDRINILKKDFGIDFDQYYSKSFRHGVIAYRAPTLQREMLRNKWVLNFETPLFQESQDFLNNILINGRDILRAPEINLGPTE